MTSRGQCPRGGACACPRVGSFFKLMTSRGQCPRGGGWGAPGVPPIQVQTPHPHPPPGWLATGLHGTPYRSRLINWPTTWGRQNTLCPPVFFLNGGHDHYRSGQNAAASCFP